MKRDLARFPVDERHRTVSEARIVGMLLLAGSASELQAGQGDEAAASTTTALDNWTRIGLGFRRDAAGNRLFDPAEVRNFVTWAGLNGLDTYWNDHLVPTHRHFAGEFAGTDTARFSVRYTRRFNLRHFIVGDKLRLRLPLPVSGRHHRVLGIEPIQSPGVEASLAMSEGRVEFRLPAPAAAEIMIGAEIRLEATKAAQDVAPGFLDAEENSVYLRPAEGFIRVTPRVHALAQALAGTRPALEAVDAFWDYMLDELNSGMVRYDTLDPAAPGDWVLEHRWYDCHLGAALFASLCRARGIPARILGCTLLYRTVSIYHYFAEVWIDGRGWLPFDVLSWDLSRGGRDPEWRRHFAGSIDQRMVTECLPYHYTGPMSVRLPPAWQMIQLPVATGGVDTIFTDLADGAPIYTDRVLVRRED